MRTPEWLTRRIGLVSSVVVACLVIAATLLAVGSSDDQHLTAYFTRTTGLYTGDEVKVLGIKVGSIDSITPQGTEVKVQFSIDSSVKVPAGAEAAIVAPSLVTGRFIQLAPAYTSGPTIGANAVIPLARTAVPVEWDTVKQELTELVTTLGPANGDKTGALNKLIDAASANLGNGTASQLHTSITQMSSALQSLSSSKGNLFQTIASLNSFVTNLVTNQAELGAFSQQLTGVSSLLASDGSDLRTAVDTLQQALGQLTTFVNENKDVIGTSVSKLGTLSQTLATEKTQIEDILHTAPTGVDDFYSILDPQHGGVVGRPALANFNNVAELTCGLVFAVGGASSECAGVLTSLLQALNLPITLPGTPGHSVLNTDGSNALTQLVQSATSSGPLAGLLGGANSSLAPVTSGAGGLLGALLPGGTK